MMGRGGSGICIAVDRSRIVPDQREGIMKRLGEACIFLRGVLLRKIP